jgi:heavy metal translocating P-type ATPase
MDVLRALKLTRPFLFTVAAGGLAAGLAMRVAGADSVAGILWSSAAGTVLLALSIEIVASLRRGDVGLDVIAALSMIAALAVGESLAAAIVALMYAGGQYLETYAERAARREMTALLSRVPRTAIRHNDGRLEDVALELVAPGDRLLVRQGDIVPVDGTVASGLAVLDQSALTGESLPVNARQGALVLSGSTNAGEAFDLLAVRRAAESTYAGIVRLVEAAQRSRPPMARLADRYALLFLALTVALAGVAWWLADDPVRAVAVLVAATPCPLILAVPVAIISGLSRAARLGILIKDGKAIEMLAQVRSLVIDKTGTLTVGQARLVSVDAFDGRGADDLLRAAASLDQVSQHAIAQAIVAAARSKGLLLDVPSGAIETPGQGVAGRVRGREVAIGSASFVSRRLTEGTLPETDRTPGSVIVAIALDGRPAGFLVLADEMRSGVGGMLRELRSMGIERIVLASGDREDIASFIAAKFAFDLVRAELTPDQKILVVLSERKNGPVMMIGDGVNDAPALAAADVGVAMGAKGAAASAEAADVVLLVDEIGHVVLAVKIARRSRHIALECVFVGLGLSIAAMVAASFGMLLPVQGALLQEVIDVAVIFNALRALRGGAV